ncbi:MAG: tetratricopeptide repeat protein [Thermomonas sp.]|jgi:hypothetical protein|uniref:tetratricopeptide repeat protein n=1 Tax=Thermomonas sp. TaxID=1971895 RepID=UPI001EBF8B33|nr:tetratricopeptide repeat protein [Thermomonas sp.]MBV2208194.1 tetratricopeptide repeat protein [Thermomonas sp.]
MKQTARITLLTLMSGLALFAAWRIVGMMQAAPALSDADPKQAQAAALELLSTEPLQGKAFVVLARASEVLGDKTRALALYKIAARRAPRDQATRLWLAQHYLAQGAYDDALVQLDELLRLAPSQASKINPAFVQMAVDPSFAAALARVLNSDPPWRARTLAALRAPTTGNALAADQVMQSLQDQGGLSEQEYAGWMDSLMAQGRWGDAYARWAGTAAKENGRLAALYNGQFESEVSGVGFDWRQRRVPGVLLLFVPMQGIPGRAASLQFLGRRVPGAGLEHPLFLMPGKYQISMRMQAQNLRSELGLQWVVACAGRAGVVGRSEPIDGSFSWREASFSFSVPAENCPGLWLRLLNPVSGGAAQTVSGDLWLADFVLKPEE